VVSKIILVTGGRDYQEETFVRRVLERYAQPGNILIQGGARGADELAYRVWVDDFQLPAITVPARWSFMGKPAGQARNHQMVCGNSIAPNGYLPPSGIIAFPGGRGTNHCVSEAIKYGLALEDYR
jgi:hypothetical protein